MTLPASSSSRAPTSSQSAVTLAEAVELTGSSYSSLHRALRGGWFPNAWRERPTSGRKGIRWRVPLADLQAAGYAVGSEEEPAVSDSDAVPAMTLTEAARETGASRSTLQRALRQGSFPNAFRSDHPSGGARPWMVPLADLVNAGFAEPPQQDDDAGDDALADDDTAAELAGLRDLLDDLQGQISDVGRRTEEQLADERSRQVEDLRQALSLARETAEERSQRIAELREAVRSGQDEVDDRERQIEELREAVRSGHEALEERAQQITELRETVQAVHRIAHERHRQVTRLQDAVRNAHQLADRQADLIDGLRHTVQATQQTADQRAAHLDELRETVEKAERAAEERDDQITELRDRLQSTQRAAERAQQFGILYEDLRAAEGAAEDGHREIAELRRAAATLRQAYLRGALRRASLEPGQTPGRWVPQSAAAEGGMVASAATGEEPAADTPQRHLLASELLPATDGGLMVSALDIDDNALPEAGPRNGEAGGQAAGETSPAGGDTDDEEAQPAWNQPAPPRWYRLAQTAGKLLGQGERGDTPTSA